MSETTQQTRWRKAISLWQPWASLWCSERKVHETRHWPTNYRGPLLVHAAKKIIFDIDAALEEIVDGEFGNHWGLELPRGAIIGEVNLLDCYPTETLPKTHGVTDDACCGDFSVGRFAWRRGTFTLFKSPIPYRGSQGFFNVPESSPPSHR